MTSGPQLTHSLLRCACPPVGGTFHFKILVMPPLSRKPIQKRFLSQKGGSLSVKGVFAKNFFSCRRRFRCRRLRLAAVTRLWPRGSRSRGPSVSRYSAKGVGKAQGWRTCRRRIRTLPPWRSGGSVGRRARNGPRASGGDRPICGDRAVNVELVTAARTNRPPA
jgi:hypothetical protein